MEEPTNRVEKLETKVQHLEAVLRYQARKINKFGTHFYLIPGISKGSLSPSANKNF